MKDSKKKIQTKTKNEDLIKMQLARALADYDNLQKRVEREQFEIKNRIRSQFLVDLLPAIDLLYDVQKHLNDPGLALSISQFEVAIESQGIEKIEPKEGDVFDENLHDAIDTVSKSDNAGKIAEIIKIGWKFKNGVVIQHSKVKVYK